MYWREIPGKLNNIYSELQCTGQDLHFPELMCQCADSDTQL